MEQAFYFLFRILEYIIKFLMAFKPAISFYYFRRFCLHLSFASIAHTGHHCLLSAASFS
jgi:hypothetical protein